MSGCSYHVETFLGRPQDVSPKLKEYATSIESGNYQEINFLTMRLQVENLRKINPNQKTSWGCNSCFTHSIYMK